MKSTKIYTIFAIIFFLIPLIIYVVYGNIYIVSELCQISNQVLTSGGYADCLLIRFLVIFIPICLIIGFALLIYASMKKIKK